MSYRSDLDAAHEENRILKERIKQLELPPNPPHPVVRPIDLEKLARRIKKNGRWVLLSMVVVAVLSIPGYGIGSCVSNSSLAEEIVLHYNPKAQSISCYAHRACGYAKFRYCKYLIKHKGQWRKRAWMILDPEVKEYLAKKKTAETILRLQK